MTKSIVAGLILVAIVMIVAHLEWRFAEAEQSIRDEMRSSYLRPCDATVSDRLHYADDTSPRCYFFKDRK
jgi:hypothetical protein